MLNNGTASTIASMAPTAHFQLNPLQRRWHYYFNDNSSSRYAATPATPALQNYHSDTTFNFSDMGLAPVRSVQRHATCAYGTTISIKRQYLPFNSSSTAKHHNISDVLQTASVQHHPAEHLRVNISVSRSNLGDVELQFQLRRSTCAPTAATAFASYERRQQ
jgi:hypothetical protein